MDRYPTTIHANWRAATRAISQAAIDYALQFGRRFWAGRGCVAYHLGRRAVRRAQARHRLRLDRHCDIAVIVSPDGALITVEHCPRPPRHWKRAG